MTKTLKQLVHVLWAIEKDLSVIASNTKAKSLLDQLDDLESNKNSKPSHDVDAILGIDTSTGAVESYFNDLGQLRKALAQEVDNKVIRISIRKLEN